jgi:hypothetical protein
MNRHDEQTRTERYHPEPGYSQEEDARLHLLAQKMFKEASEELKRKKQAEERGVGA